jgi:hypothetical protein
MKADGSQRLIWGKEEEYAQQRAFGYRHCEAARRAGLNDRTGIATKYERKLRVQRRIAYLRRDDQSVEMIGVKRRHIEDVLELIAFGNLFEFVDIDDKGDPSVNWRKLAESELATTVADLKMDKDTGKVVSFTRQNALNAIAQLREMRGFKQAERHDIALHQADQLTDAELLKIAQSAAAGNLARDITPALPAPREDDADEAD